MDEAELYVRQEAYYNAVPDGKKLSRAEQIRQSAAGIDNVDTPDDSEDGSIPDTPDVSVQELQEIPMPELSETAGYLVALLRSAGYAMPTGMGLVGFSWQEIEAWMKCNDYVGILSPREVAAISRLSRAYAAEASLATKKDSKPPYVPKIDTRDEDIREMIAEKVEDVFASMLAAQKRE